MVFWGGATLFLHTLVSIFAVVCFELCVISNIKGCYKTLPTLLRHRYQYMTNMAASSAQIWYTKMYSVQDTVTSSAFDSHMHHATGCNLYVQYLCLAT